MSNERPALSGRGCPVCGEPVPAQPGAGRPNRYCSSRCKSRAARQRRAERELAPQSVPARQESSGIEEHVQPVRTLSRQAAMELLAADPDALNAVLVRVKPIIAAPTHQTTGWGQLAATIRELAAMIPEH